MASLESTLAKFEKATLPELRQVIRNATREEAAALRAWLGGERYERIRRLMLRQGSRTRAGAKRGNVVVLHGIMGAELSVQDGKDTDVIWVRLWNMLRGRIKELEMREGRPVRTSFASDMLRKYYLEALTTLDEGWNVQPFWYDWRASLDDSADALHAAIQRWFGDREPVHLVAHSMGGLVSRTYIQRHGRRWDKGGHLLMLGTPNHGSFAIPQVITGVHKMVRKIGVWVDQVHSVEQLSRTLNTFPGSLQMLPSPFVMPSMERMYRAGSWAGRNVTQALLDRALRHHEKLLPVVDAERMIYIAGSGFDTAHDVADWGRLDHLDGYQHTPAGDETVPHRLGLLHDEAGRPVRAWYARVGHGDLANHEETVSAVDNYLTTLHERGTGEINQLQTRPIGVERHFSRGESALRTARLSSAVDAEVAEFAALISRERGAGGTRTLADLQAEEQMLRGFLSSSPQAVVEKAAPPAALGKPGGGARPVVTLHLGVKLAKIQEVRPGKGEAGTTAYAAGHYEGVEPQVGELALDEMASKALKLSEGHLIITEMTRRGTLPGGLGCVTVLPLPDGRRVALAGMGGLGEFGGAELTVMAQELCWTLGQQGVTSLRTLLIGGGEGNLSTGDAMAGWVRGILRAARQGTGQLREIEFVEYSPERFLDIANHLGRVVEEVTGGDESVRLVPREITGSERKAALKRVSELCAERCGKKVERLSNGGVVEETGKPVPTRITLARSREGFEFGALTQSASLPLRPVEVDPLLVEGVGRRLVSDSVQAVRWGRTLERLLIPRDLGGVIFNSAQPVVMTVDGTTARLPLEMLALPDAQGAAGEAAGHFQPGHFVGTAPGYGLTRQLRTRFAPVPSPAPGKGGRLRVLVVADPAEDAPLAGAQEEGLFVADFFEGLRAVAGACGLRIEVKALIGPSEATREDVAALLFNESFDILHFAGHCLYDAENPRRSGWLFHAGRDERFTAAELSRLDRVPAFVFSNACESGVTPDRLDAANLALGPAFAEAFFERGVRNFVCTAWPVNDAAALAFARTLYLQLFKPLHQPGTGTVLMHEAMRAARVECAGVDALTWGAYQHYGDPAFNFGEALPARGRR